MIFDIEKYKETVGEFAIEELISQFRNKKITKITTNIPVWKNENFIDAIFQNDVVITSDSFRTDFDNVVDTVYITSELNDSLIKIFNDFDIEILKHEDVTKDFLYKKYDNTIKEIEKFEEVNDSCVIVTVFYNFFKIANLTVDIILEKISEFGLGSLDKEDLRILKA